MVRASQGLDGATAPVISGRSSQERQKRAWSTDFSLAAMDFRLESGEDDGSTDRSLDWRAGTLFSSKPVELFLFSA